MREGFPIQTDTDSSEKNNLQLKAKMKESAHCLHTESIRESSINSKQTALYNPTHPKTEVSLNF